MTERGEYIFERLQVCVADVLNRETSDIKPTSRLAYDLNADSLDAVEFVMRVEEEFGFEVEDEDYFKFVDEDAPLSEMEAFVRRKMEA